MPYPTTPVVKARSILGNATRSGDALRIKNARRDLAAAKLEAWITKTVAEAPPFTREQRDRLAGLLQTGGDPATESPAVLLSATSFRGRQASGA